MKWKSVAGFEWNLFLGGGEENWGHRVIFGGAFSSRTLSYSAFISDKTQRRHQILNVLVVFAEGAAVASPLMKIISQIYGL